MSHAPLTNHNELSNTDQPSPLHLAAALPPPSAQTSPHSPGTAFLCTICRDDSPDTSLHALLPTCNHVFCLSCVLSWSQVREVCPNCKASFTSLLVHRDLTGAIAPGPATRYGTLPWIREHVALLQRVEWVQTREVLAPLQDLTDAITLAPARSERATTTAAAGFSPAPHYLHEDVEDELESRFWEEEEKQFDRLMGSRVMSNRRFGANGYIASGRLRATHRQRLATQTRKKGAAAAGSSSAMAGGGTQDVGGLRRELKKKGDGWTDADTGAGAGAGASGGGGGGRKKKLKKKSREGLAAAARKKAEAEAEAAAAQHAAGAGAAAGGGSGSSGGETQEGSGAGVAGT